MASERAVPPCGMMPTLSASTLWRKASSSRVSGHCRKAAPAKATRPRRSALAWRIKSKAASLAFSRRLGGTSLASMLREVSTATTMSRPRCRASSHENPQRGPARAASTPASAASEQRQAEFLAGRRQADGQRGEQARLHKLADEFLLDAPRPVKKSGRQRQRQQQNPKEFRPGEIHGLFFHGNFLHTVWLKMISSRSRLKPPRPTGRYNSSKCSNFFTSTSVFSRLSISA